MTLYDGGRTLHSPLGIDVDDDDYESNEVHISMYGPKSQRAELLQEVSVIIIDEFLMFSRAL